MNQHAKSATTAPTGISPEEWQARTDLAAVYRLCAHYGWDDIIYNHCSMRVPGEPTQIPDEAARAALDRGDRLESPQGRHERRPRREGGRQPPGLHAARRRAQGRPDVNCAVHVHTETGMAISGLKSGLRMVSQQAIRFYKRIGYHPYEGITEDFGERERINKALGRTGP